MFPSFQPSNDPPTTSRSLQLPSDPSASSQLSPTEKQTSLAFQPSSDPPTTSHSLSDPSASSQLSPTEEQTSFAFQPSSNTPTTSRSLQLPSDPSASSQLSPTEEQTSFAFQPSSNTPTTSRSLQLPSDPSASSQVSPTEQHYSFAFQPSNDPPTTPRSLQLRNDPSASSQLSPTEQQSSFASFQLSDCLTAAINSVPVPSDCQYSLLSLHTELLLSLSTMDGWSILPYNPQRESIQICLFSQRDAQPMVVSALEIPSSLKWVLYVHSVRVEVHNIPLLSSLPVYAKTASTVLLILSSINKCQFCPGNDYEKYAELVDARGGSLRDSSGMYLYSSQCLELD